MLTRLSLIFCMLTTATFAHAQVQDQSYRINPGDILDIFVWNEKDLMAEVLVRPDGMISMPLAGQVQAGGQTPAAVEEKLTSALAKFLKDKPTVTVSLKQTSGYKIYVLGKVNRPGEYPINRPTDVMQALALAGGLNAFAAENSINVLHRNADGTQVSTRFRYNDVKGGDTLESNRFLESGDIVVVP